MAQFTDSTLEAAMTAVSSRLGLASRKAGSDTAALKRKEVIGSGFKGKQVMKKENLRKKLTYSAK